MYNSWEAEMLENKRRVNPREKEMNMNTNGQSTEPVLCQFAWNHSVYKYLSKIFRFYPKWKRTRAYTVSQMSTAQMCEHQVMAWNFIFFDSTVKKTWC